MRSLVPLACLALLTAGAAPARAAVTGIEITAREPFEDGRPFGAAGAYVRMLGRVSFAVDPRTAANRRVVDLELAPRNREGRVEFSADLEILAPADLSRASGTLLYDVNNRGRMTCLGMFNGGADGFLMRQGHVVVASGWIGELLPGEGRLLLRAPAARGPGGPVTGLVRAEMAANAPAERLNIAHWANHGSHPPTERGRKEATLTWRRREKDPRVAIPREQWRLEVEPVPEGGSLPRIDLVLAGGFRPGYVYELIYEARDPIVQGLGLAGIRDLVSYLKHAPGPGNPLAGGDGRSAARRAIGFGTSQSGRCLRQLLYDGFNADEAGRIVFEGLFPHVAGAGMGFFNHRFASPTRHNTQHDNHLYPADVFPFTYGEERDPFTGRRDAILQRARAAGTVPRIFHTQTSAEYWHRAGSLVHTDPKGERDAALPPEVRVYALGGAQHGPGSGIPGTRGSGWHPPNPTDYRPLLRGLLTALEAWIRHGTPPPPSRYPRLADGTLTGWREAESGWRALPGVRYPEAIQQPEHLDHGPEFRTHRRLTRVPPRRGGAYGVRVPAADRDNNDRGTLTVPSVSVPLGTLTGWNLRHPDAGADGELLSLTGSFIPFAATAAERRRAGDPRPALRERYPSFAVYRERIAAACDLLIRERYVLEEDRERLLALAERLRDLFGEADQ